MKPVFSVIIPHFERATLLRETVASVLASSERRFEIVIVDDGSGLEQWEKVKTLAGPQVIVMQRVDGPKGPSRCRNLGLNAARGDYVMFLDSDDLMASWCLEQRLQVAMAQSGDELLVFPVLLFSSRPGDSDKQWNVLENSRNDLQRFLLSDPVWQTSSPLWRRNQILTLGGFNEAVFYGDDADLHIRALMSGVKVQKQTDAIPDIFIRRSDAARITNSLSPALVESRRIRLQEGTRFLKNREVRLDNLRMWEGQYFVEAEFLLFNLGKSRPAIAGILSDWQREFRPNLLKRCLVKSYFGVALAFREKAYLLLRLARRIAIRCLPIYYFPSGGLFQQATTPHSILLEVRRRVAMSN